MWLEKNKNKFTEIRPLEQEEEPLGLLFCFSGSYLFVFLFFPNSILLICFITVKNLGFRCRTEEHRRGTWSWQRNKLRSMRLIPANSTNRFRFLKYASLSLSLLIWFYIYASQEDYHPITVISFLYSLFYDIERIYGDSDKKKECIYGDACSSSNLLVFTCLTLT